MSKGVFLLISFASILLFLSYLAKRSTSETVTVDDKDYKIREGVINLWISIPKSKIGGEIGFNRLISKFQSKIRKDILKEYSKEIEDLDRKIEYKKKRYKNLEDRVNNKKEEIEKKNDQLGILRKKVQSCKKDIRKTRSKKEKALSKVNEEKEELEEIKKETEDKIKELKERESALNEKESKIIRDMKVIEKWEDELKRDSIWYKDRSKEVEVENIILSRVWYPIIDFD